MRFNPTFRRVISAFTGISLVGVYALSALLSARPALAEGAPSSMASGVVEVSTAGCRGASTAVSPDPCEGANEAANQVDDKLIKPAMKVALLTALLNLATFVFDRLAYEAAIWVATGGEGETPLFNAKTAEEAWKDFGLDIAGDAIGQLNEVVLDELNLDFDICAPENPLFKLSIQLGLKQAYQPQEPTCDFQDIRKNWDSFITTTAEQALNPSQTVLKAFAEGFKPGQNELSATVGLNLKVHQRVLEAKTSQLFEQVNSDGFKSVTDVVTGKVKTPSSVLQNEFQRQISNSNEEPTRLQMQAAIQNSDLLGNMFLHVAGVFTNTLLSTLMNKIYTGLFEVQPDIDPFDDELSSISSRDDAADRFASLITVAPTQVENYNILSEFVACPIGPVAVRGINNCVMDSSFVTAVSRAESGVPLTVQEAIDEGLINADWPLIPHEGDGIPKNQDPLCYSYGYCYGNLVKMRKARILPVGWEIAASRNDPSNPATLQEIIDGFNDCGTQGGGVDDTHQWCHLIDPEWVLKYPETQCRALVNGELQISTLSPGRSGACVDTPSCISESNDGSCDGGFGYCVQENNVWRFRGDECPEQYASCLSFENTFSGDTADLLFNTVDQAGCNADNAGCEWYRTNKYYDDGGTTDDTSDDTYEWLPGSEAETGGFVTADREDDIFTASSTPTTYSYATTGGTTVTYDTYAYQDRIYFNNNIEECSEDAAGCSEVYQINDSLALNVVQNPSFEDDEDEDGQPDSWSSVFATGTLDTAGTYSYYGSNAYSTTATGAIYQSNIQVAPGNFYTFSFYARQAASGGTDSVTGRVVLTDAAGSYLDLAGTSVAGDCAVDDWAAGTDNSVVIEGEEPDDDSYQRYECVFTVPDEGNGAMAQIWLYSEGAYLDAVQLELGEDASSFTEGYNSSSPSTSYLLIPPDYLGCTGASTDPAECDSYTQVCEAQDVGCNLYTPEDGDPAVPAIASTLDECPSECVGYTTYKQEATEREDEDFPLYFIAERATACSSQYVGCDAFTNLDTTAEGGEGSESYTYLRACVTPEMATGDAADNVASTYFTWEGSDAAGYQLVTWSLLESNKTTGTGADAPCAAWDAQGEDVLVCDEDATTDYETDDCDEHDDIFENPDCREFYDTSGAIHYRDVTLTVAVDSDCHPYRFDDTDEDSCETSGGYWTDGGDCRYFGLSEESTECPAAQAGCREFTGGAGRNATTVFEDDFEDGDLLEYDEAGGAIGYSSVSNESVATDGHSMRIAPASADGTVSTYWVYLDATDTSVTYDDSDTDTQKATCTDLGWDVTDSGDCEIDEDADGTVECTVENGDNGCGTLDDLLVSGKSYVLSFWAKGSSDIEVYMHDLGGTATDTDDIHDLVDPSVAGIDALSLDGAWHSYDLGPIDSTDFENFDDGSVLTFAVPSGATVYLDNVRLKSTEENVTLIKDSWIVPSTCDQTPDGAESDQYYLGCEAYVDQDGNDANLYQFSDLCSEEVVGCEAVYDTQNSDSVYGAVYNARCAYVTNDPTDDNTVASNTDCELDGETACAISAGESFCLFDRDGALPATLPSTDFGDGYYYMQLGPEAVVVDSDVPMYLVDNGDTDCTSENVGCEEIGLPTYNQEKTEVTEFESAYYLNDPDSYEDILCEDSELFCEEWSSTQDGNFYFKDPVDQTCEYKTGVTIDGNSYYGWFKSDTTEPCYDDYVIAGEQLGIWRNGDDAFAGWAGTCSASYDLCTEFRDISDSSGTTYPAGTPYYFMDDDALSEEALTASEQCQGQVSQKEGCGLFYDTNDSELTYNTTASYIASVHADDLFGDAPGSKQDPISCGDDGSGGELTTPDGESVNLCETRCYYDTDDDDEILTPSALQIATRFGSSYTDVGFLDGSCYVDADCPTLDTANGEEVEGTCVEPDADLSVIARLAGAEDPYMLSDDANRVLKVYRDRECSAWLSCQSSQVSWNSRTSKYETICDRVGLCTRYTRTGDSTFCTEWTDTDAVVLDAGEYADRDVTWNGNEYSGYAIPDQLPVEHYDQINVAPDANDFVCVSGGYDDGSLPVPMLNSDGDFKTCVDRDDSEGDCPSGYVCRQVDQEFRLGHIAGSCDLSATGWLGECIVGHCEESGDSCASDGDCSGSEQCVVGYCQDVDTTVCYTNDDDDGDGVADACSAAFPVCDTVRGTCVDQLAPNADTCVSDTDCSGSGTPTCTPDTLSKTGACVNNQCATDIHGDPIVPSDVESQECRGYPETSSPFTTDLVTVWIDPTDATSQSSTPEDYDWQPYSYVYGFETVNTCSPTVNDADEVVVNDDCVCSYDKVQYGSGGAVTRYYPPNTTLTEFATDTGSANTGVCIGGDKAGQFCSLDTDCQSGSSYSGGTCAKLDRKDTIYGWDGYCLERDTSIQKNGSSSTEDRACITWLPVDQLSGATDLYGKYLNAGYNDGETYYCAEMDAVYHVTRGDIGYVAALNGDCDDGFNWDANPEATCPDNAFMAVEEGSCTERTITVVSEDFSTSEITSDFYTYYCAPLFSFIDGDPAQPCDPTDDNIVVDNYEPYKDCQTPWMSFGEAMEFVAVDEYLEDDDYGLTVGAYAACSSVVQVASTDLELANKAFTNRVWENSTWTIGNVGAEHDGYFGFQVDTDQAVFGKADQIDGSGPIDTDSTDSSRPLQAVMCSEDSGARVTTNADDSACLDYQPSSYSSYTYSTYDGTYDDARAYKSAFLTPSGYNWYHDAVGGGYSTSESCSTDDDCNASTSGGGSVCVSGQCELIGCDVDETDMGENGCNEDVECGSDNLCSGGPRDGRACAGDNDCQIVACVDIGSTTYRCQIPFPVVFDIGETDTDLANRIQQIFATSLDIYGYTIDTDVAPDADETASDFSYGEYQASDEYAVSGGTIDPTGSLTWDVTATGKPVACETDDSLAVCGDSYIPSVPVVVSLGSCEGTECEEGTEDAFSVNGIDSGDIEGSDGYKSVTVSFFTYADPDQMPIKNIVVDWGDDDDALNDDVPWDTGSQSGSTADDNFYQNHRGFDSDGNQICSASEGDASDFGYTPNACDTSYVTYVHSYVCNVGLLDDLPACETTTDPNGLTRLLNSPCAGTGEVGTAGSCVFQPRVSVKDNWGWCTGYCDSEDDEGDTESVTDGMCYGSECSTSRCPGGTGCPDSDTGIDNPWINFDGYVIVTP